MNLINHRFFERNLQFHFEAGTSRGVLTSKKSYFVALEKEGKSFVGEAGPLKGLSPEFKEDLFEEFQQVIEAQLALPFPQHVAALEQQLKEHPISQPSFRMAYEMAVLAYLHGEEMVYFDNAYTRGEKTIPINGLIWMGSPDFMRKQIEEKLEEGYRCLKLKIGAIDFEQELAILASIRERFTAAEMTLRVDANGAFNLEEAPEKLARLAAYDLHSIEQPIRAGQWEAMHQLCRNSPIDIALDEELIGVTEKSQKIALLEAIRPPYIILKPSLLGGFFETREWIQLAEERQIGWWITSALESNYGLKAIAQFTANYPVTLPQGLGTGKLYTNNFDV